MHDALRNALSIEMGILLEELPVLHQKRAARTGRETVLVVSDRNAGRGGQRRGFG